MRVVLRRANRTCRTRDRRAEARELGAIVARCADLLAKMPCIRKGPGLTELERNVDAPPAGLDGGSVPVLSHFQADVLLTARAQGAAEVLVSLDLGLTQVTATLTAEDVVLPEGQRIGWEALSHVRDRENMCFELRAGLLEPIRAYSTQFSRAYQLLPTESAPALLLSGFLMHRIAGTSPREGAHAMVNAVLPVSGRLLDTATGLGYAALEAARHARSVVTVELDPMAQLMARKNPWSRALFDHPRIERRIGDSAELIKGFADGEFAAIVHDPPSFSVAGELYSEAFYIQVFRVLARGGRFFHYIGNPESNSGGRVTQGVLRRLQQAGFRKIARKPDAFGVLATK
jgi:uncharacterized protein